MTRTRVIAAAAALLFVWIGAFLVDFFVVSVFDHRPIFCMRRLDDESCYVGLGYSYAAYPHPITGKFEYCLYIFGAETISTFTD